MSQVSPTDRPRGPRPRGRRTVSLLLLVGVLALLGAACNTNNTPTTYNAQDNLVQTNFVDGCTGQGTGTTLAPTNACTCAINWIVANVPYDDANKKAPTTVQGLDGQDISQTFSPDYSDQTFKAIDSDLANHPENLPQFVKDGLASACGSEGWKPAPTGSAGSGGGPTTVP
jgi:hypothetical protein